MSIKKEELKEKDDLFIQSGTVFWYKSAING